MESDHREFMYVAVCADGDRILSASFACDTVAERLCPNDLDFSYFSHQRLHASEVDKSFCLLPHVEF